MKLNYIFALLLLCQLSFAQTEKHLAVPGTKCSIIPPSGFIASDSFSGFFNAETGASIIITEIPAPYKTLKDGFTEEALKTKGMILLSKQAIEFNGAEAILFNVKQPANGIMYQKQILMFGDSANTILVNGIYPEDSKDIEATIKASLLTTSYNAAQNSNYEEAVNFTINVEGTDFKIVKSISGSLLYSTDGKIPTNKPTLIAGSSISKIKDQDQKQYAIQRFKELPDGEFNIIKSNTEVTIDDMNGYEIIGEGKNPDGKKELIYQVMLFNGQGDYYILVGLAAENLDKNLEVYRLISKTFKRK